MAVTAKSGPTVTFGITGTSTNGLTYSSVGEYNDQRAPNVSDLGTALADPRAAYSYKPGNPPTELFMAFYNNRGYHDFITVVPSTVGLVAANTTSTAIAAGAALTLAAASTARGTYSVSITAPESGTTVTGLITPDSSVSQFNAFGQSGTINTWAPGCGAGRCVSIVTSTGGDTAFTVVGRDIYGYKITEQVSIGNALSVTSSYGGVSQKAFKYISAIYNASTPASTGILGIGFADRFGFPLHVPYYGTDITVRLSSAAAVQNAAIALSTANAILPMASSATATSTTADVRGIWISSVATSTNYRVQIAVVPSASAVAALSATDMTGLFGATQYSSV